MSDKRGLDELIIYYGCSTTLSSPEIVHSWEATPNNYERRKK